MLKQNTFSNKIYAILVGIIIFLVPTNFFLKFFESTAYVNGLRVDYLIPKLYLSDIFILIVFIAWLISSLIKRANKNKNFWNKIYSFAQAIPSYLQKKQIKSEIGATPQKKNLLIIIALIFFARQLWTNYPISSIFYLLRIIGLGFFAAFLLKNNIFKKTKDVAKNIIEKSILITLLFQSSVAIYQYIAQKSLFGYYLLGEPNLNNYIGVAKTTIFGAEKILPYGTTAHPNLLGGFLAFYLLYIFNQIKVKNTTIEDRPKPDFFDLKNIIILIALVALILTQSVSAILALLLGLGLIFYERYFWGEGGIKTVKQPLRNVLTLKKAIILTFVLFTLSMVSLNILAKQFPENQSIVRRNYLNVAAINMAQNNILMGVGLNNFTSEVENFSPNKEVVRFVQPAHNIFLLFFAETGLLGLALISAIIYYYYPFIFQKNWRWLVAILPIALLDHYLITMNTGILLISFLITIGITEFKLE